MLAADTARTAPGPAAVTERQQVAPQGKHQREPATAPATEKASTIEKAERPGASQRPDGPTEPEPTEQQQEEKRDSEPPAEEQVRHDQGEEQPPGAARSKPRTGSHRADLSAGEYGEFHVDRVSGDEPLLPARVHRPSDLMRLLLGIAGIALVLGLATFAHGTTQGLENDIGSGAKAAPRC